MYWNKGNKFKEEKKEVTNDIFDSDRLDNVIKDLKRIYRELKEVEEVINKDKKHIELIVNSLNNLM